MLWGSCDAALRDSREGPVLGSYLDCPAKNLLVWLIVSDFFDEEEQLLSVRLFL